MKKIIINQEFEFKSPSYEDKVLTNKISIELDDMPIKEVAKFLVEELDKWNGLALNTIKSITIE